MAETIGFIGVGRMGSRMATNLLDAGFDVVIYDVEDDRVREMVEVGAEPARSISALASAASVVMTSLPSTAAVSSVYFGDDPLIEAVDSGIMLVEMSTVETEIVERIADGAPDDNEVVDCPVIGPPPEAKAGTLTIVVGSSEAAFQRITPILDPLCNSLHHVGDAGAANRIKLANNVMTFGNFAIAAEMIALVDQMDIDPEQFFKITSSGAASSAIADLKMHKAFEKDFEPEFTLDNARKDLQYALSMKEAADFPAPLASSIAEQYTFASSDEGGEYDYSILVEAFSNISQ